MAQITLNSSGVASSGSLLLQTNGTTTQATVDTSGNLGLGVTPSAWGTNRKAMQLGSGSSVVGRSDNATITYVGANAYYNGTNNIYLTSGVASLYAQDTGGHNWFTAASGTAGNSISFTQAMTLDASGNLGIGTTSPTAQLHLYKNAASASQMTIENASSSAGSYATVQFNAGTVTSQLFSDAAAGVYAAGAVLRTTSNHPLIFGTNGSERARIDSSGSFFFGTTSSVADLADGAAATNGAAYNAANPWFALQNSAASNFYISKKSGYTDSRYVQFNVSNSSTGTITTNGSTTSYNTSSDYRLKENIQPMTGALIKIAALKPCTYTWKSTGEAGEGFIAHELAEIVPDAVAGEKDAVNEDGSIKPQGIDTSFLVATLTAALQEMKAIVDAQAARITALEQA